MINKQDILNASILIVDDQQSNVLLIEELLQRIGYTNFASTTDPTAVLELYRKSSYDLVLLDLHMPKMNGFEVMEGLKAIETEDYLPVLVITAQPSHKLQALATGAKDFIAKPFDLEEMQTRIHNMLEVRLLYKKVMNHNQILEQTVLERTAELRESEARFRRFTELSSDWYWEQDSDGNFTNVNGPVAEMLGILVNETLEKSNVNHGFLWNETEREILLANLAAKRPFLDFVYSRTNLNGSKQFLMVSGEPMFDLSARFIGYRGIGKNVTETMRPNGDVMVTNLTNS